MSRAGLSSMPNHAVPLLSSITAPKNPPGPVSTTSYLRAASHCPVMPSPSAPRCRREKQSLPPFASSTAAARQHCRARWGRTRHGRVLQMGGQALPRQQPSPERHVARPHPPAVHQMAPSSRGALRLQRTAQKTPRKQRAVVKLATPLRLGRRIGGPKSSRSRAVPCCDPPPVACTTDPRKRPAP